MRLNITRAADYNVNLDTVVLEIWTGINGSGKRLFSVTGITTLTVTATFNYKLPPGTILYMRGKVQRTDATGDSPWIERSFRTPA